MELLQDNHIFCSNTKEPIYINPQPSYHNTVSPMDIKSNGHELPDPAALGQENNSHLISYSQIQLSKLIIPVQHIVSTHKDATQHYSLTNKTKIQYTIASPQSSMTSHFATAQNEDEDVDIILQEDEKYTWSTDEMVLGMTGPTDKHPVITHCRPATQSHVDGREGNKSNSWRDYEERWKKEAEQKEKKSTGSFCCPRCSALLIPRASVFLPLPMGSFKIIDRHALALEVNSVVYYNMGTMPYRKKCK